MYGYQQGNGVSVNNRIHNELIERCSGSTDRRMTPIKTTIFGATAVSLTTDSANNKQLT